MRISIVCLCVLISLASAGYKGVPDPRNCPDTACADWLKNCAQTETDCWYREPTAYECNSHCGCPPGYGCDGYPDN